MPPSFSCPARRQVPSFPAAGQAHREQADAEVGPLSARDALDRQHCRPANPQHARASQCSLFLVIVAVWGFLLPPRLARLVRLLCMALILRARIAVIIAVRCSVLGGHRTCLASAAESPQAQAHPSHVRAGSSIRSFSSGYG